MTEAKKTTAKPKVTEEVVRNIHQRVHAARINMEKLARTASGQVGSHKYNYVTHENVIDTCLELLSSEGVLVTQGTFYNEGGQGIITRLINIECPADAIDSPFYIPHLEDPQKVGSWFTYLKKYTLKGLLALPDTDDDDGAAASGSNAGNVARRPKWEPGVGVHEATPTSVKKIKEDKSAGWTLFAIDTSEGEFTTFERDVANGCHAATAGNNSVNIRFEKKKGRVNAVAIVE